MVAQQEYADELNQLFKSINAWINLSKASFDYQLVLADIWVKAFAEVIQELRTEQIKGEDFLQVWSSAFDREFAHKLRSEDAVLLQGKLLNTAIDYWPHQQKLSKEFFPLLQISSQINLINLLNYLYKEKAQVGVTPKEEIYREDKVVLYRYKSAVPSSLNIPVLIVYALVNRPDIVDLQAGRSLVANLLKLGLDVYLIDWGYPSQNDRWLTIDKYINGYINNCVDIIRDAIT